MWINALAAFLTAGGLVLTALGARAWWRYGELRFGLLCIAYAGFLAEGLLVSWGLFVRNRVDDLILPILFLTVVSLFLVHTATLTAPGRRRHDAT